MDPDSEVERYELTGAERERQLQSFIQAGLELIKQGEFEKAMTYFKDKDVARSVGFDYKKTRTLYISHNASSREIKIALEELSFECNFTTYNDRPRIELGNVESSYGIPKEFAHGAALGYAEEWCHGLQHLAGPLAGLYNVEADVGVYFLQQGVPLTQDWIHNYSVRAEAVEKARVGPRQ